MLNTQDNYNNKAILFNICAYSSIGNADRLFPKCNFFNEKYQFLHFEIIHNLIFKIRIIRNYAPFLL